MADRYDMDRDRERRWDADRIRDRGRESNPEYSGSERSGDRRHEDWHRDRERRWSSSEGRYGEARYENYSQQPGRMDEEWRDSRNSGSERFSDYGDHGDWGNQARWGEFANRADYDRANTWREDRGRDNMGRTESDFGGQRSGRTNLFGTGGGGFGTGFSSYGAAMGPYGAGALGGGMSAYGERGRFAGRGPKGWQRSDDRIREDINERLTDHPHIDASEIEVKVQNGEVTLTGMVDERHAKRLAEDIAESVSGVREVHNQLRVQQPQQGHFATPGIVESRGGSGGWDKTK